MTKATMQKIVKLGSLFRKCNRKHPIVGRKSRALWPF
jgi:hypothetical protein